MQTTAPAEQCANAALAREVSSHGSTVKRMRASGALLRGQLGACQSHGVRRWTYVWDAENRLVEQETLPAVYNAGVLQLELRFWCDWEPCPPTSLGNIIPSQLEGAAALHCITKKFRKKDVSFRSGQNQRPSLSSITMRKIFILMEIGRRLRMDSIPFIRSNLFF